MATFQEFKKRGQGSKSFSEFRKKTEPKPRQGTPMVGAVGADPNTPRPKETLNYRPEGALKPGGGPERGSYEEYEQLPGWQKPLVAADDIIRILADTASFGYLDKALGPEERLKTQQARDRAGWAGTGAEVASLMAAPSAVGRFVSKAPGLIGGGLRGLGFGAEGAAMGGLSAAGHDQDIGEGMMLGGAAGAGGSALGSFLNKIFGRSAAKATQEYPTNAKIVEAADASKGNVKSGIDLKARARRVEEAARAQAGGKEGFAELTKGIENAGRKNTGHTYKELEAIRHAGRTDTNPIADAIKTTGQVLSGKGYNPWVRLLTGMPSLGIVPLAGGLMEGGANLSKAFTNAREQENLMALLRDPQGNGLKLSPEVVNMLRDKLSRGMIGSSFNAGD